MSGYIEFLYTEPKHSLAYRLTIRTVSVLLAALNSSDGTNQLRQRKSLWDDVLFMLFTLFMLFMRSVFPRRFEPLSDRLGQVLFSDGPQQRIRHFPNFDVPIAACVEFTL